ncbi:MAG TPA: NUDIX domain-containing protein [Bryobacteraceae bacterium]|jgi:predicted NUDIX family NTP pyrophosphohydrolase|nr:NUDIX domain-containing protein [Bryobacteraceae bacterium]
MAKRSGGILLFRRKAELEIFLVHPGGPFWAKKDLGAWSIPKGEYTEDEDPLDAARREFMEETGAAIDGEFLALGDVKQAGGKIVIAWAIEHDLDAGSIRSNTFEMEWPPRSGHRQKFPEVDRAGWFSPAAAMEKLIPVQAAFVARLQEKLATSG